MKRYRIRKYSPAWWLLGMAATIAFVAYMSIPSTIEFWGG